MARAASSSELLSIAGALELVLEHVEPRTVEDVPIEEAYGRFIASDVGAAIDLPPFASSAMDGFAVRSGDTPGSLRVVGESAAGSPYDGIVQSGEAVAISTGAVVPEGADAVVPIEVVVREGDGSAISVAEPARADAFVRHSGSDIGRGAPMLASGRRVGPAQIGAAAAVGLGTLPCRRRPRVAILSTGSELVQPGGTLGPGDIFDANRPMLRAALRTTGADVAIIPAAADTREEHRGALERALEHDVVVSTGGVSVGEHDLVRDVGFELGVREVFWRVAMRPGKPLAFGVRDATLLFGLPGNPVSTLVGFELFVRPALLGLQGAPDPRPPFRSGVLDSAIMSLGERDDLIRVRVVGTEGRETRLAPLAGQQSHQIAVAAQADGLALIPRASGELSAGTEVDYLPLHEF
jgi:molybdopterin molybdotransferase